MRSAIVGSKLRYRASCISKLSKMAILRGSVAVLRSLIFFLKFLLKLGIGVYNLGSDTLPGPEYYSQGMPQPQS